MSLHQIMVDSRLKDLHFIFMVLQALPLGFRVKIPRRIQHRRCLSAVLSSLRCSVPWKWKFWSSMSPFRMDRFSALRSFSTFMAHQILYAFASCLFIWKANNMLTTWQDFLANLKHHFDASMYEDHQGNLSKLTQTTTVVDVQYAFGDLMNKVTGILELLLISFFITGLKSDIRRELLCSRPTSLMEAFALARAYEALSEEAKTNSRSWPKWTSSSLKPTPAPSHSPSHHLHPTAPPNLIPQPFHLPLNHRPYLPSYCW